jgi:hypothetical protein
MASTAADIIASAKAEAEAAKQSAIASLSGLGSDITNAYNTQQAATTADYQNQLSQLQNAYQANAKAAYGNYMSDKQQLNNQLVRLGLQNTGYGVSQGLLSAAAYSKNLAGLQNALQTNKGNLGVAEQKALANLYSDYAKNKLNIDQYIYEAGKSAYDKAYANSYQAQQDAIANALQQQYYSYLMSSRSSGGSGGGGSYYGDVDLGGNDTNNEDWFTKNFGSYDNARKMGREKVATILESGLRDNYISQSQAEEIIRRIGYSNQGGGGGSFSGGGKAGGR